MKHLPQSPIVRNWQSWDSNLGLCVSKVHTVKSDCTGDWGMSPLNSSVSFHLLKPQLSLPYQEDCTDVKEWRAGARGACGWKAHVFIYQNLEAERSLSCNLQMAPMI